MLPSFDLNKIYLAFDIHDVLAQSTATPISLPLFQAYGHVLRVNVEGKDKKIRHYLYPFVKELFQLIANTPGIEIAFATSSKLEFAKPFIKEFLIACLGEEKVPGTYDKVRFIAREHLRDNKCYDAVKPSRHALHGNRRKDLDDLFPNTPQEQRVLIDDDRTFAAPHQAKNFLHIDGSEWTRPLKEYQELGVGFHLCTSQEKYEKRKQLIETQDGMALFHNSQGLFRLAYRDKEGVKEMEFNQEESSLLADTYAQSIDQQIVYLFNDKLIQEAKKALSVNEESLTFVLTGKEVSSSKCEKIVSKRKVVFQITKDSDIILYRKDQKPLSLKESKLFPLIMEHWQKKCSKIDFFTKESESDSARAKLYDRVWRYANTRYWKERLITKSNHILLLTGAIFKAFEESKKSSKPISQILFKWQLRDNNFDCEALSKREELFLAGLELLRKINPHIEPITFKSFETALALYPSLPDDGAEELDSCCIS